MLNKHCLLLIGCLSVCGYMAAQRPAEKITTAGEPAQLEITAAADHSIRITLKPLQYTERFPFSPAVVARSYAPAAIRLTQLNKPVVKMVGSLQVQVSANPLRVQVTNAKGQTVQTLTFSDSAVSFNTDGAVLGLGEGGPLPTKEWRQQSVEFDRRGRYYKMEPRWQADAYGSRNPAAMLIGTNGWGLFVATPWVQVDLRNNKGKFIPWVPANKNSGPQTEKNQQENLGKGHPPIHTIVPGLFDIFVFDAHQPAAFLKDFSTITGPAVMPPKWALGYMQSHRTLVNETQMIGIVDSFRTRHIPLDAVIYLGTGFAPRGWNKQQPSFEVNPEVFHRLPEAFFDDMHQRHVKVVLHMVPWDRDKLATLQGNIPALPEEVVNSSHIQNYWAQHVDLVKAGADAFWPDEGDWFNLDERVKRHQLYYQGPLSTTPNVRPWSLHRNGYPGIAQWGGWVWSGDTESSWKTLETQMAVGLNYSLSISPYWGTDIGGFYSNHELTGELYARWFQFAAFCPSFRAHGRTWRTRLPWGWGSSNMGPSEDREPPLQSEMNNPAIEPIAKKYDELRYQLLPYNYTLAWQARTTGLPFMRAMWLHYPNDTMVSNMYDQFLWGSDLLIAPVYKKGAVTRNVYLPKGTWYNWWTNEQLPGNTNIECNAPLETLPIFARAGAIIPFDPVRQFTAEATNEPTTIKIFTGADGNFTLYQDDGISQAYLKGEKVETSFSWTDRTRTLTIAPQPGAQKILVSNRFTLQLIPSNESKTVLYNGKKMTVSF